ncbi:hypothetical protein ASPSYDRAFT_439977 [Aspergillus sydowii CBS 593.65]|uniref:Uncharacterized protein n=1 Tax=Aspergillus sydowii CBS 593.65 TaxID=1036612 RepID=A0A1L9T6G1_9EURO|nr:uncharacterized protein ASPSYDRAFT_439977 [Aspergillus sydowii CBS 593.65]OJJ55040.1 hypothetical protein ASPSYDRAFT_439977 [Aspergillus sydowii CBS 593.65]
MHIESTPASSSGLTSKPSLPSVVSVYACLKQASCCHSLGRRSLALLHYSLVGSTNQGANVVTLAYSLVLLTCVLGPLDAKIRCWSYQTIRSRPSILPRPYWMKQSF